MTIVRITRFAVSVVGSWLAGIVGAFLVWNFIYGIGVRVIADETYYRLHGTVTGWGGVAGALVALATALLLRRPAPGVLTVGQTLATVAGIFGGAVGWREGLWAYFGTLLAFALCLGFRALRPFPSDRDYEPKNNT